MAAGREIAGIPKKMGSIPFIAGANYVGYLDDLGGRRVCSGTMSPEKSILQIKPGDAPIPLHYLSLRIIPSASEKTEPKVCELLASTWKLGPGEMSTGTGTLNLDASEADPYHALPIIKLTKFMIYRGDMEASSLQVLAEF